MKYQVNKEQNVAAATAAAAAAAAVAAAAAAATSGSGSNGGSGVGCGGSACSPAVKPPYTYTELIEQALSEKGPLTVAEIYRWISWVSSRSNSFRWQNLADTLEVSSEM